MVTQPSYSQNILVSIRVAKTRLEKALTEKPFLMAALVMASTFILYLGTLIPEVGWGDSAELSLVANQLGITHPPGYPLYTILGKLCSVFFTDPAIGTNLLSALCSSLASGVLSLLIFELTAMPLISVLVAIVFSVLPNIWEMAVVTEVYNVNIFFLGCSIYLFLRAEQSRFTKFFIPSAVFFGLSLGTWAFAGNLSSQLTIDASVLVGVIDKHAARPSIKQVGDILFNHRFYLACIFGIFSFSLACNACN